MLRSVEGQVGGRAQFLERGWRVVEYWVSLLPFVGLSNRKDRKCPYHRILAPHRRHHRVRPQPTLALTGMEQRPNILEQDRRLLHVYRREHVGLDRSFNHKFILGGSTLESFRIAAKTKRVLQHGDRAHEPEEVTPLPSPTVEVQRDNVQYSQGVVRGLCDHEHAQVRDALLNWITFQ